MLIEHQQYTTSNSCEIFTVHHYFMKFWDLEDKKTVVQDNEFKSMIQNNLFLTTCDP